MTEAHKTERKPDSRPQKVIHRVCTQCNGMFRVTPENYEAKQCPKCHKSG